MLNIPEQSIVIWVSEETTEGETIGKSGIWIPNTSGMRVLPVYSDAGVLTGYRSLGWALLDITNALSCQYSNAQKSLLDDVYPALASMRKQPTLNDMPMNEVQSAVVYMNTRIESQEMTGRLGEFLIAWQGLEQAVRYLMLKARKEQRSVHEIYTPDKSSLAHRVKETIGRLDQDLLAELQIVIPYRNAIVHGIIAGHGETESTIRPIITHQDLVATMFLSHEDPNSEKMAVTPTSSFFPAESVSRIARRTRRLNKRLSRLSGEPDIAEQYEANSPAASHESRNRRRRDAKRHR